MRLKPVFQSALCVSCEILFALKKRNVYGIHAGLGSAAVRTFILLPSV